MVIEVSASPAGEPPGDSAPADPEGEGSVGPLLPVGDPGIDGVEASGGDAEVHADNTMSDATSGTADARADPIRARYQDRTASPGMRPGAVRLRARQRFFGEGVSGGTVRSCAESSISLASRRSRVSSFFALITQ
jgi:hypothetical protein